MKKYFKIIILLAVIFLAFGGYFVLTKENNWKTYTNINQGFSFSYPNEWGEPRIYENQENTKFGIDFGNYGFYVNNGYYFSMDVDGKRPTVSQLVQYYQVNMDSKNEIKDFQTTEISIDNHSAIKVTVDTLAGTHYTDVYIYEDTLHQDKFILITGNRDFVDGTTFSKVLSTFKFK